MKLLRLALRSVLHFRSCTLINILGMVLSLACVIIIFRYIHSETNVDQFNTKLDRIYATTLDGYSPSGETMFAGIMNYGKEATFKDITKASGVEKASTFSLIKNQEISINDNIITASILSIDSAFFDILDYQTIEGTIGMNKPNTVLISQSLSEKLFGKEPAIGKILKYSDNNFIISGVLKSPETKNSLKFDLAVSSTDIPDDKKAGTTPQTLVLLHSGVNYKDINNRFAQPFKMAYWNMDFRYQLYPLKDLYLAQGIVPVSFERGNKNYLIVFSLVAILLLFIGVINFVNICTVAVSRKSKELSMKKVFGASALQIFIQLLAENLLLIFISLIGAFFIVKASSPFITNTIGIEQVVSFRFDIIVALSIFVVLPLIVTLYPFLRYKYSSPINSLKKTSKVNSGFLLIQYIITIGMIIVSGFFLKQFHFMVNTSPGYHTQNIIKVQFGAEKRKYKEQINKAMSDSPLFSEWCYGFTPYYKLPETESLYKFKRGEGEFQQVTTLGTSNEWLDLFNIEIIKGHRWGDEELEDSGHNLIISESACKLFGITDIDNTLLQPKDQIWLRIIDNPSFDNPPYRVIGVFKDFYASHLGHKQYPIVLYYSSVNSVEGDKAPLLATITSEHKQEAITFMKKLHAETVGGDFSYTFVEDEIRQMYKEDKKAATVYSIFTVVALIVSSLGLFSMSLFDIRQRYKEIAVRKVNGASFVNIISMLLKKYTILLCIAFTVASPLAWLAINRYLDDFALKTPVSWWLFALAFIITATISLLTLIYQTRKAARTNPSEVLKSE